MSDRMRLANQIYWAYIQDLGALGVGNIMLPVDGVYYNIDEIPSAYINEVYGHSKEELLAMIAVEVESAYLEESLNDA